MKLVTLTENTSCRPEIGAEHGLSLYLETGGRRLLFDTGQSDLLLRNASALGVDLAAVDTVVLSHGHYDHGGGLPAFLDLNSRARVYASRFAFGDFYHGPAKYIGLPPSLRESPRILRVSGECSLGDGLTLYPAETVPFARQSFGLSVLRNGEFCPDDFLHEQYLLLEEEGKRILFSGCSHRGILGIARRFRPDILIGGFHFMKLDPRGEGRQTLEDAAQALLALPTRYYTCHCTGVPQYEFLKALMGDRLSYLPAGSRLDL